MKRGGWLLLPLLALAFDAGAATCHLQAADAASAGGGECAQQWMDRHLKLNDLTAVGTHNSYKQAIPAAEYALIASRDARAALGLDYAHKPLAAELDAGARQLELDVVRDDPQGGRYLHPLVAQAVGSKLDPAWQQAMAQPGLKTFHVPDVDFRSSCVLFRDCLRQLLAWSNRHPRHVPIMILVNAKDGDGIPGGVTPRAFDAAGFDELDAEIRSVLPKRKLIVPDDVQGKYPTLREAVLADAWPTLAQARGKFLFALDESPEKVALYRGQRHSLEGRAMFVNTDENSPAAAYMTLNDAQRDAARIADAVRAGFIVRTRADSDTTQARSNDIAYRDQALASGAQWVSTDYLWPDVRLPGGFSVRLSKPAAALCNPLRARDHCTGVPVETVTDADRQRAESAPLDAPAPRSSPMTPPAKAPAGQTKPNNPPQPTTSATSADVVSEVDPYLGADWGGRVFVGAATPFGMVKLGPDMEDFDGRQNGPGYLSAGRILGFSHLHVSGTSGKYGNVLVMPVAGELNVADIRSPRSGETAQAGYFAAHLSRYDIDAELTSSDHVGFHRYRFAAGREAHVTVALDHLLQKGNGSESQKFLGGELWVRSPTVIEGVGRYIGGWNEGGEYRVHFHLEADNAAAAVRTWAGTAPTTQAHVSIDKDQPFGASLDYPAGDARQVQLKVGISFVSLAQARAHVATETPGWGFDQVRAANRARWQQSLARIDVQGATPAQRRQLYTGLYHAMLMPVDKTGENPKWKSFEPYYDDYYAVWDTFRTVGPLLTLIAPERQRDMLRSLIDIYRHEGWMPDARSGDSSGRTQGGSNADVLIADAYVKGLQGIDYKTAFAAMLKDASVEPDDATKYGRGGLRDYNTLGYVGAANERSGSRTVEYAYDDFAIAQVACGLGRKDEMQAALKRSGNWANLWDKDMKLDGLSGYLRPRNADGSWAEPYLKPRGTWADFLYEGDVRTYSLYAPHDVRELIALSGGERVFNGRLDTLFYKQYFDLGNEPGFLAPMLYLWAGRPDKAADIVSLAMQREFLDSRGGLPGNDDSGAMSAWYVWQMLGIYPNAGQDVYLIGTPGYAASRIDLGSGKSLRIVARNFDPQLNRYVQSATLNGQPLETAWFRHAQIRDGGELVLTMGAEPSGWGRKLPPPSLSDPGREFCQRPGAGSAAFD